MQVSYPPDLPISGKKDKIIEAIHTHQVVVVAGDTGSGKTTQIPKMCLDAGRGKKQLIGCTQPRRIAAISVAERVAEELRSKELVGYKIRFRDDTSRKTRIKFMTDGILLAETRNDMELKQYDTIIIDEAHERSLNIDFLLGYVKTLLMKRPELKVIIASATLDTEKFSRHFNNAPIINVSGRTYPVEIDYIPSAGEKDELENYVEQAAGVAVELHENSPGGDILIFMPTERDILDTKDILIHKLGNKVVIHPLFGRLHAKDQRRIFRSSKRRKIVIATNIAETSLTVPGIRYVIDTGLARISRYNPRARTTSLQVQRISQASCDQRAGRCGRTGPGHCFRLYAEEDYASREQYTQPEIQRSNLGEVILQMISLELGDPRQFPFLDPPAVNSIRDGYKQLQELGALTQDGQLTSRGKIMARLPLDPCISRIIVEASENNALREIKVIAAGLSIQDPRVRPLEQEKKADELHRRFLHEKSDFLTLLNIWESYHNTSGKVASKSKLKKFCQTHFLSWQRMREWQDIYEQINRLLKGNPHFRDNTRPASYDAIHRSLLSGFLRNIGQKKEKNIFTISGGREVMLFPGSSLFNRAGKWVVAASFMETGRLYAMSAATIDGRWLEQIGGELCRYSWSDPHWEKRSGQVIALEKVSLFGLVIVSGRKVNFAKTSKQALGEAREIFIREALVTGNLGGRYSFLMHNRSLIQKLEELEHRTRRRNILVDDARIFDFYDKKLGMVHDRRSLNREIRKHRSDKFLWMTEEDIVQASVGQDELYRFPKHLQAGGHTIRLDYCFEPGNMADGITADIPVSLVDHFDPALFEWLVPGLLGEKILALLKGLPKQLRKRLIPLPETAEMIMDSLELYKGSLYAALEAILFKFHQVRIRRTDWHPDKLPVHLKMRFRLLDGANNVIRTSRSYNELQEQHPGESDQSSDAPKGLSASKIKKNIRTWDFPEAPAPLPVKDKNNMLACFLYPMLVIDNTSQSVELQYTRDQQKSFEQNRDGLRFLYSLQFPTGIKAVDKECKNAIKTHSASWLSLGLKKSGTELQKRLLEFLLNELFCIDGSQLPTANEFEATVTSVQNKGLIKKCCSIINHVLKLLVQRRSIQAGIEELQRSAKGKNDPRTALAEDFAIHLQELLPANFLEKRKASELTNIPRYLNALKIRMERAKHSPAKDAKKTEQVTVQLNRLNSLPAKLARSANCITSISEYRQMIEEYRVSIYAPELGTTFPVSEKRLKKKWQEVEDNCLRVE